MLHKAFDAALKYARSDPHCDNSLYELIAINIHKSAAATFQGRESSGDVRVVTQWDSKGNDSGKPFSSKTKLDLLGSFQYLGTQAARSVHLLCVQASQSQVKSFGQSQCLLIAE